MRLPRLSRGVTPIVLACLGIALVVGAAGVIGGSLAAAGGDRAYAGQAEATAPCAPPAPPPKPVTPTTVETIGQAYRCILDHYVAGARLDDRTLLIGAFAGLTQELGRRGLDRTDATVPALTGNRDADWNAFAAVYQRVVDLLPNDAAVRQAVAAAAMAGLVQNLHDNHVGWVYPYFPPEHQPGEAYGLGFATSPSVGLATSAPKEALPPLYISTVLGGPAEQQGLRAGDVIVEVNDAPPFSDGQPSPGVLGLLAQQPPRSDQVKLTLQRPSTGRIWTVTMKPALFKPNPAALQVVTSTLLKEDIASVRLTGFPPGVADQVLQAIAKLGTDRKLKGVILDMRANGGGSPTEVARLLGAFVHGRIWSYDCDAADACTPNRTDDSVALLSLPLVALKTAIAPRPATPSPPGSRIFTSVP